MKEVDLRPICPACGRVELGDWGRYCHEATTSITLFKGCDFCGSPLVADCHHCCSNPECSCWSVSASGKADHICYKNELVFSVMWDKRLIVAINPRGNSFKGMEKFYKKLFYGIVKNHCKNSNIYKNLSFIVS